MDFVFTALQRNHPIWKAVNVLFTVASLYNSNKQEYKNAGMSPSRFSKISMPANNADNLLEA